MGRKRNFISVFDRVPSLTPRPWSTLRRAHVTPVLMQDAHTNTRMCMYTQQSLKALCCQGYQWVEGGWCLLSFEACFPSPEVSVSAQFVAREDFRQTFKTEGTTKMKRPAIKRSDQNPAGTTVPSFSSPAGWTLLDMAQSYQRERGLGTSRVRGRKKGNMGCVCPK